MNLNFWDFLSICAVCITVCELFRMFLVFMRKMKGK